MELVSRQVARASAEGAARGQELREELKAESLRVSLCERGMTEKSASISHLEQDVHNKVQSAQFRG